MQNVITCLGFNNQAEEAVNLYTSVDQELEDPEHGA